MKKISELYQTSDMNLVVSAITAGVQIHNSERNKDHQTVWFLERSILLDRVVQEFFAGTLSLPVQFLFYNQRLIKNQISSKTNL